MTIRPLVLGLAFSALAATLAAAPTAASAQTLSPTLEPGLWETDPVVLINGRDLLSGMRQMQDQIMASLPAAQRQQMAAMMAKQGLQMAGGKVQQCLTQGDTERATHPEQAMAEMRRNAPRCQFDQPAVSGSKLTFSGRCDDPKGYTGDITGEFIVDSPKAWHGRFGGQGKMAQVGRIPGIQTAPDGTVKMQMESRSHWVSVECGSVKPHSATR
ncbi:MAG: DUF3617 domain-containing protein [Pseudomonadota bacterium]|nr:DUF3617 domain-containing protein [Pseudomonadota bacterium]